MSFNANRAQPNTFLSPPVRKLLVEIGSTVHHDTSSSGIYLTSALTFSWPEIQKLICELSDCFNINDQSSEWFSTVIQKMWPVFAEANKILTNCSSHELEQLWNLRSWTRKETEIQKYFSYFIAGSSTSTVETVLFLTAVLERSLGNIFLLKGNNVPFLLRDLLSTEELRSVLGVVPTVFIQVLLGTPKALNLRNVTWHGFPYPEEIKPELCATLFIITGSIGEILSQSHIAIDTIPYRPQVSNLMYHAHMLEGSFIQLNIEHKMSLEEILFQSPHIAQSHQIYWSTLLEHYYNQRYGECILLLLPQLEHMLRSVFCWANKCPDRVLTAESTAFYTTLDEILCENINDKNNEIRTILGDSITIMLQDIFVLHKGPRIRDKVSHGECDLDEIPQNLVNHILCVALAILLRISDEDDKLKFQEVQSDFLTLKHNEENGDIKNSIREGCKNYESKFHSSSLIKTLIITATEELTKWKECPRPEEVKDLEYSSWEESLQNDSTEIPHLKKELWNVFVKKLNLNVSDNENHFHLIIDSALKIKILTLYRSKNENDILNILKQIADNVQLICKQVQDGLEDKYDLLTSRLLRSRQRDTYRRMLNVVPWLHSAIQYIILLLVLHLVYVNDVSSVSRKDFQHLQRYLKQTLQYVQNVVTYTSTERNRWDELKSATSSFAQQMLQNSKQSYILHMVVNNNKADS